MKCLICGKECIDKDNNICSNCSSSGLEYKENPPVKTKNFSDLLKEQKDKIISECYEVADEEQAELLEKVKNKTK